MTYIVILMSFQTFSSINYALLLTGPMTKYWMLIGSEAYNYSLIVLFIINVLPKQTKWRQAKRRLAAKDSRCTLSAILNLTA